MFASLLRRRHAAPDPLTTARVPEGVRVYAIGDIHGRADVLAALHERIRNDAAHAPEGTRCVAIYLGDYVDRGPDSPEVIDALLADPLPGIRCVHLRGNHEAQFLEFLESGDGGAEWLRLGGDATLFGYGARWPPGGTETERLEAVRRSLLAKVPPAHLDFLRRLRHWAAVGDYFFAHAGVNPTRPLDDQDRHDLLWIRRRFLDSAEDFGKVVVHGHSTTRQPEVRGNRIGIDTGAYLTGRLTALVLDGHRRRFLVT